MNAGELQSLEIHLGVVLPSPYRDTMLSFPVPELAGNWDSYFWDNGPALLQLNQQLRAGHVPGFRSWPPHMLAIGRAAGDDVVVAIDTRDPMAAVWSYATDENVPPGMLESEFPPFVSKYIEFAKQSLVPRKSKTGCLGAVVAAVRVMIGLVVALSWWWMSPN